MAKHLIFLRFALLFHWFLEHFMILGLLMAFEVKAMAFKGQGYGLKQPQAPSSDMKQQMHIGGRPPNP